jgi:ubiquinone biosynthesis protein Coq4
MDENVKTDTTEARRLADREYRIAILAEAQKDPVLQEIINWVLTDYESNTIFLRTIRIHSFELKRIENLGTDSKLHVYVSEIAWNDYYQCLYIIYDFREYVNVNFHLIRGDD